MANNQDLPPLDPNGRFLIEPATIIPGFRRALAEQKKTTQNILIKVWGGLGDIICAEPTLRYALENFKDREISLASSNPEFFEHLKFKNVFNFNNGPQPIYEDYYVFNTMSRDNDFPWDFLCQLFMHCVDFASLVSFRCQLPIKYKPIVLKPDERFQKKPDYILKYELMAQDWIVVHPGKHWQSKTFPKWWWDRVLERIKKYGVIPVLIGSHLSSENGVNEYRSTVDVNIEGCLDLRDSLELMETVHLLQNSRVLLTNDSCPLHMAASADCWIGFITIAKNPEFITHHRGFGFGWKMQNFSKGGIWQESDVVDTRSYMYVEEENLLKWLPDPETFADWGIRKCR